VQGNANANTNANASGKVIERIEEAGEGVLELMSSALGKAGDRIPTFAPLGQEGDYIPLFGPLESTTNTVVVQPPSNLGISSSSKFLVPPPQPPLQASSPNARLHGPKPRSGSTTEKVQVYYYDPSQALYQNGQLVVPSVVYDQSGRAVSTQALGAREILVEPPLGATPIRNSTGNATNTNSTWTHPMVVALDTVQFPIGRLKVVAESNMEIMEVALSMVQ
jgi:hypothetical protein